MKRGILLFAAYCSIVISAQASAETVKVAVAANFSAPMKTIVSEFEATSGHSTQLSFASSGKLFAQISNGAPYHVFLSADTQKPDKLEELGMTVTGSRFTYALGRLILWSKQDDYVDTDGHILRQNTFRHLALANPKLAPYGHAAVETLKHLGLWTKLQNKQVLGENISQTYQFLASGNAELGFIALSQVMKNKRLTHGSGWLVPYDLYPPIRQEAVLLSLGKDNPAALALLRFLTSDQASALIESYGYRLPDSEL